MDPLDDFQFKPLTDGLGFHKKKTENGPSSSVPSTTETASPSMAKFSFQNDSNLMETPLPRRRSDRARTIPTIEDEVSPGNGAVDEILKTLNKRKSPDFVPNKDNSRGIKESKNETTLTAKNTSPMARAAAQVHKDIPSFMAAGLDAMLIVAASLLCLIIMLTITKVDLIGNLTRPDGDGMVYISTLALFLGVYFIYMVVNRVFMAATPGEWAFDQQLGTDEEVKSMLYIFKVIARTLLTAITGFFILPLIAKLFQRDIAGSLTGAQLIRKS